MKYLAPILVLFGLISLTSPDGLRVWIVREQITSVVPPTVCSGKAGARVNTGDTFLCVQETVENVISQLTAAQ